ncbi:hypothetical protein [Paenarthrobacter sp. YJN-5]|uniref:hypothetical protein n=1 Tax=Paenarthrobacter sp. YJN-5 TaxID=2735316 RepID=UPI0018778677|nr:hypothetical protein [Paenarthrobacter sp. YJN-5]QOT15871.1 hypothetical protein HMI59_04215 [Paenarthrobacter sp. YJN-5]
MTLSWVAVNVNNGQMIADLPELQLRGMFGCTMMRYETQTASLPALSAPPNWRQATRPGAVWIVCLDDDGSTPLWGGMVIDRRTNHAGQVELSLATPEAYFDRRYVGNRTYTGTAQNLIAKDLIESYVATAAMAGIALRVQVVGSNGTARDRSYKAVEDKTVYSVLGDLAGVIGGPEWTVGWENVNNLITPVFYVGNRIGRSAPTGLKPAAQFYLPGSVTSAELGESYTSQLGANRVIAVSSGVDDARPQSSQKANTTDMRPAFEYRWSPSTSITDTATLDAHADRALAAMKDGGLGLEITANRAEAPRLGKDWFVGDDIGFDLTGPAWPDGIYGTGRCVGWRMDANTIQPLIDVTAIGGI